MYSDERQSIAFGLLLVLRVTTAYFVPEGSAILFRPTPKKTRPPRARVMFYIIGLGLCDEKDITLRGLEVCNLNLRSKLY